MDAELKKPFVSTGTTILGIVCKEGVVMAGDQRATLGHIIFNRDSEKVIVLNERIALSGCGSASEVQKISKLLTSELKLKELKSKSMPTVRQAASLLSNIRSSYSAFILGGVNEDGKTSLYEITGGHLMEVKDYTASAGSGMAFSLGLLERHYKEGMSVKEGVELAVEALKSSTQRDTGSGNGIEVFTITKDGIKKVVDQKILQEYRDKK